MCACVHVCTCVVDRGAAWCTERQTLTMWVPQGFSKLTQQRGMVRTAQQQQNLTPTQA